MKHILYIHQYFKTPEEPGGTRSYWLAKELIKYGYSVSMITSSVKFNNKITRLNIDGIDVIYIKEDYNQNMSFVRRLIAFFRFMYKSTVIALKQKNIDLVFATSTPLTIGIPALVLKKIKKTPYIFEVRDLWPEVPIQMGAIKNTFLIKLTKGLEKIIYVNARHIIALSPGMKKGVLKYVEEYKVSMISNMSKKDEFWSRKKNINIEKKLGLNPNSFKIVHFGALGLANGADSIIDAAKLIKDDKSIEFLFLGGGSEEPVLKEQCKLNNIHNVKFLGRFSMKDTSEIVNLSDVSIVSFKDLPILYTNSPNKLFDSLSAGKPIIVNSAGWTKDLVEKYSCGFYVNPNNPKELIEKIRLLQNNHELTKNMGLNSRKLAENRYDKSILCKQFVEVIKKSHV